MGHSRLGRRYNNSVKNQENGVERRANSVARSMKHAGWMVGERVPQQVGNVPKETSTVMSF